MLISRLTITVPEGIRIKPTIEVTDQAKSKVTTHATVDKGTVTIDFTQPVLVNTILEIDMQEVDAYFYIPTNRLFFVSATVPGLASEIPLGIAHF